MPCRPSAPPVTARPCSRSRASRSATPSVTMRRVRSLPRSTRKLVAKPSNRRDGRGHHEAQQRIAADVLREQAGGVGAERRRTPRGRAKRCRRSRGSGRATARTARGSRSRCRSAPGAAARRARRTRAARTRSPPRRHRCARGERRRRRARARPSGRVGGVARPSAQRARANRPCGRTSRIAIISV